MVLSSNPPNSPQCPGLDQDDTPGTNHGPGINESCTLDDAPGLASSVTSSVVPSLASSFVSGIGTSIALTIMTRRGSPRRMKIGATDTHGCFLIETLSVCIRVYPCPSVPSVYFRGCIFTLSIASSFAPAVASSLAPDATPNRGQRRAQKFIQGAAHNLATHDSAWQTSAGQNSARYSTLPARRLLLAATVTTVLLLGNTAVAHDNPDPGSNSVPPDSEVPSAGIPGVWSLRAAGVANFHDYSDSIKNNGIGLGFLEGGYRSPDWQGWQLGAALLGVVDIWERRSGDADRYLVDRYNLRELFLRWESEQQGMQVKAGRFRQHMTGLDGHSHQGIEWRGVLNPNAEIRAGVIHRWIDNGQIALNFRGISGWRDVGDLHDAAGDLFWLTAARFTISDSLALEPFVGYQQDVMLLSGVDFSFERPLANSARLEVDGTLAVYGNQTPASIKPDYEDVWSWIIHAKYRQGAWRYGLGWFGVGNQRGNLGTGIFDWFDPMTVDETMPFDDNNNAQLYFATLDYTAGPWRVVSRLGFGVNRAIDVDSRELNVFTYYDFNERLTAGAFVSYNRYSEGIVDLPRYTRSGFILDYKF